MSNNRKFTNRRTTGSEKNERIFDSGPYLARVVSHLDNKFMGSLRVQLIKTTASGDYRDLDTSLITAQYASPFYGVTPVMGNGSTDSFQSTQKSYGFWAVPPDVDTKVLVTFVEGRRDICFWFACVPDDYMNFMVPDGRPSTVFTTEGTAPRDGRKYPVGEYNKLITNPNGNSQPSTFSKPVNTDFAEILQTQGLLEDDFRGLTSSSARREVPSAVFGISTPGPLDKRPGAPLAARGDLESKANVPVSRLTGHSIVLDDGDDKILRKGDAKDSPPEYVGVEAARPGQVPPGAECRPANELFRIRTRTGHQLLFHNTEDLIYISNSRGTAWIELSSNGKIDIYAQDSISVHSEGDFNVTADRDINLTAGSNVNIAAGASIRNNAGSNYDLTAGGYISDSAGDSINWTAGTFIAGAAGSSLSMSANGGDLVCQASASAHLHAGATVGILGDTGVRIAGNSSVHILADGILHCTGTQIDVNSGGTINMEAGGIFNLQVASTMYTQVGAAHHLKVGGSAFLDAAGGLSVLTGFGINLTPTGEFNVDAGDAVKIDAAGGGGRMDLNSGAASPGEAASGAGNAEPAGSPPETSPQPPISPTEAAIAARVPQHEPWFQHENLNPLLYTLDKTRAGSGSSDSFVTPILDTFTNIGRNINSSTSTASQTPGGFRDYRDGLDSEAEGEFGFRGGVGLTDNAKTAMDYFIGKGLTPAQAAGIVGNLQKESTAALDNTISGDGGRAYGIAQWNDQWSGDRVENFEIVIGTPLRGSSLEQQLDFIWWELTGTPGVETPTTDGQSRRAYTQIKAIDTGNGLEDSYRAAIIFENLYERSADDAGGEAERGRNAQRLYRDFVGGFNATDQSAYSALPEEVDPATGQPFIVNPSTGRLQNRIVEAYDNTRNRPVNERLKSVLNQAAHLTGVDRVTLYSGKQPGTTGGRIGTPRHDTGDAADLYLTANGKRVSSSNAEGRRIIERYAAACVALGALGLGHGPNYMNDQGNNCNMHIDLLGADLANGGGRYDRRTLTVWRSSDWFRNACLSGLRNRDQYS